MQSYYTPYTVITHGIRLCRHKIYILSQLKRQYIGKIVIHRYFNCLEDDEGEAVKGEGEGRRGRGTRKGF